jgi:cytochrome c oxidase subunit 3
VAHTHESASSLPEPFQGKFGVWLFLATEVLLFGGLFILYSMYRYRYIEGFHEGSRELDRVIGTANTMVLITSSLFVALAGRLVQEGKRRAGSIALLGGAGMGAVFLIVKAFEWSAKFEHGLFPGSPVLTAKPPGEILFFALYFVMTGLHALHVLVGMGILVGTVVLVRRMALEKVEHYFDGVGLYWHLVDIIWVFLFPLMYLVT